MKDDLYRLRNVVIHVSHHVLFILQTFYNVFLMMASHILSLCHVVEFSSLFLAKMTFIDVTSLRLLIIKFYPIVIYLFIFLFFC